MYGVDDRPNRLCDGQTRREWLHVGGVGALGLGRAAGPRDPPEVGRHVGA
jgi:hypothetical protein